MIIGFKHQRLVSGWQMVCGSWILPFPFPRRLLDQVWLLTLLWIWVTRSLIYIHTSWACLKLANRIKSSNRRYVDGTTAKWNCISFVFLGNAPKKYGLLDLLMGLASHPYILKCSFSSVTDSKIWKQRTIWLNFPPLLSQLHSVFS